MTDDWYLHPNSLTWSRDICVHFTPGVSLYFQLLPWSVFRPNMAVWIMNPWKNGTCVISQLVPSQQSSTRTMSTISAIHLNCSILWAFMLLVLMEQSLHHQKDSKIPGWGKIRGFPVGGWRKMYKQLRRKHPNHPEKSPAMEADTHYVPLWDPLVWSLGCIFCAGEQCVRLSSGDDAEGNFTFVELDARGSADCLATFRLGHDNKHTIQDNVRQKNTEHKKKKRKERKRHIKTEINKVYKWGK